MISADEAREAVLRTARPLELEEAPLAEAVGRALARDLRAVEDSPRFDNSAMDGYAVRAVDLAGAGEAATVSLALSGEARAGKGAAAAVAPGRAARVFTGAPLPEGADAVVMQEVVEEDGERATFRFAPSRGDHIRSRGEELRAGDLLARAGDLIRPYEVALLASQGIVRVPTYRDPVVSIVTTGDELVEASRAPAPAGLRDSNGPALAAALSRWGARPRPPVIVPDDPARLKAALEAAFCGADLVVTSGGVSVGRYDHSRAVLLELGAREIFWKAAIKPGKPLFFGERGGTLVFGVPGNPVAALVCAEEFVRPAVEAMRGRRPTHPPYHMRGRALNEYPKTAERLQYLFCQAREGERGFELEIIRPQGSAMSGMACRANALAVAPAGVSLVAQGDELRFRWLK